MEMRDKGIYKRIKICIPAPIYGRSDAPCPNATGTSVGILNNLLGG
jgi:hypothetical protein